MYLRARTQALYFLLCSKASASPGQLTHLLAVQTDDAAHAPRPTKDVVLRKGFEPSISSVKGRRPNR